VIADATLRSAELASSSTTRSAAADAPHRTAQPTTSPTLRLALASALSQLAYKHALQVITGAPNLALANASQTQIAAAPDSSGTNPSADVLANQMNASVNTTLGTLPLASASAAHLPFVPPLNSSTLSLASARRTQTSAWPATTGMSKLTDQALASASQLNAPIVPSKSMASLFRLPDTGTWTPAHASAPREIALVKYRMDFQLSGIPRSANADAAQLTAHLLLSRTLLVTTSLLTSTSIPASALPSHQTAP